MIKQAKTNNEFKDVESMSNRHMKIFITVYEKMNMTAAADSLFVSQPSVSQGIKDLEAFYGVKLFERYPKKLYPTAEGDLLYMYAKQILGLYDEVQEEIKFLSSGSATITVGANISAGTVLIRKYIDKFNEEFPNVSVHVKVSGSAKLSKMIYNHTIDFALMEDLVYDSTLIQQPFYKDRIVFVCSPENIFAQKKKIEFKDLMHCDFLLREKGVGVRDKFDYLMMLNDITIEPVWESSNTKALINAVRENYGIAVLPYLLVEDELENGELVALDMKEESLNRNLNIVYHKDKIFNKWTERFIEIIKQSENESAESEERLS